MLRAIVFDFDGVIANSEPLHFRAYREVLAGHGVGLIEADYFARYLGFDDRGAFEAMATRSGVVWSAKQITGMIQHKARLLEALERDAAILFPGAEAAIQAAADVVPIAIASGALGSEIRRVLDRVNLTRRFSAIVSAEDTAASKPAPDPYLRAVAILAASHGPIEPRDCVAVEDSRWGLESARAAGLRTVAVAHTYDAETLKPADLVIPSIRAFDMAALQRLF